MALTNRPLAAGRPRRVPTLMAPADSPKAVTFPGSPPKPAMLSRTHPADGELRRPQPQLAHRRSREGNPAEAEDPVLLPALDLARCRLDDRHEKAFWSRPA